MLLIGQKNFLWLVKSRILCHRYTLLVILMVEKLIKLFIKKIAEKNQTEFRIEKVVKKKVDRLYVKWKGYDNSFSNWIDKNDFV